MLKVVCFLLPYSNMLLFIDQYQVIAHNYSKLANIFIYIVIVFDSDIVLVSVECTTSLFYLAFFVLVLALNSF